MKLSTSNSQGKSIYPQRQVRVFSEELKRKKVKEIEQGLLRICDLSREWKVSRTSIHKWVKKYSLSYEKETRLIMESKSETIKVKNLKAAKKEIEQLLGQKQIQIEFYEKLIELINEEYGIDVKKTFGKELYNGIGKTD